MTLPRWALWTAGGTAMTLALTAGGLGLTFNVSHGLQTSPAVGLAFGLADVGKILIPIVAAGIGWTMQTRITVAICAGVSIWCAVNFYVERNGHDLAAREGQATAWATAQADATRIRAELAGISETGTPDELTALATAASERGDREAARGGCSGKCEAAKTDAARLLERAAQAKRKATLERALDQTQARADQSGGPTAAGSARQGLINGALFLMLIEVLVWLNIPASRMLASAWSGTVVSRPRRAEAAPAAARRQTTEWTPQRVATLQSLWGQGLHADAIAAQLGITTNAMRVKARRLGLTRRAVVARPRLVAST